MEILDLVKNKSTAELTDEKMQEYIDEAEVKILNYCNISVIPEALCYTWRDITLEFINHSEELDQLNNIIVGDIAVIFKSDTSSTFSNYQEQLNKFRKL